MKVNGNLDQRRAAGDAETRGICGDETLPDDRISARQWTQVRYFPPGPPRLCGKIITGFKMNPSLPAFRQNTIPSPPLRNQKNTKLAPIPSPNKDKSSYSSF